MSSDIQKTTSGFGIASLILGLIACLSCWIPLIGLISLPFAFLALLIGAIGIISSAISRKTYLSLSLAGVGISIIAIGVAVQITAHTVRHERPLRNILPGVSINESDKVKQEYVTKIDLYDFEAKYQNDLLDGRIPGFTFKLKNNGDRILSRVTVIVYFKNKNNQIIAEEDYWAFNTKSFSFGSRNKPLKPNYIWQIEKNEFYKAKNVPSEWQEGNAEIKITDIEFEQ